MELNFYSAFFMLNVEDARQFERLIEEDDGLQSLVDSSTAMWRGALRRMYPNPIVCRQMFRARSMVLVAQSELNCGGRFQLAAAFALFIADRVEERVRELDAQETVSGLN
jgi:hypothetical protein